MTPEQTAAAIRIAAAAVWLAVLIRTARRDLRVAEGITAFVISAYAVAQAYRALVSPSGLLIEFTIISAVAIVAGLAVLTVRR